MGSPPEHALGEPLHVIRLHDPRFTPLDATGARMYGGRWNSPGAEVVYTALSYGGAILETRVHANVRTPPSREIAVVTIPAGLHVAEFRPSDLPGWDDADQAASRAAGDAWLAASRTVALIVPSRAGAPLERNVVLNLGHADAKKLHVESLGAVPWDLRLFGEPELHVAHRRAAAKPSAPRRKK
jgi:RES domain-containing protein